METMMTCGHSANGLAAPDNVPVCLICGCLDVTEVPDLEGRTARCSYYGGKCKSETESKTGLAFFKHDPYSEYDSYYCGCYGWN